MSTSKLAADEGAFADGVRASDERRIAELSAKLEAARSPLALGFERFVELVFLFPVACWVGTFLGGFLLFDPGEALGQLVDPMFWVFPVMALPGLGITFIDALTMGGEFMSVCPHGPLGAAAKVIGALAALTTCGSGIAWVKRGESWTWWSFVYAAAISAPAFLHVLLEAPADS